MKTLHPLLLCLALVSISLFARSSNSFEGEAIEEIPAPSEFTKEHEWLAQFEGEWESTSEAQSGPDEKFTCQGKLKYRMLGKLWLIGESEVEVQGTTIKAVQTIGYDETKKKYVGTWVDSMLNHMWKYEGSVDKTGKILSLEAEGPDFSDPKKTAKYKDTYEFKSKDHVEAISWMQDKEGKWVSFMTGQMRRKGTKTIE